VSEKTFGLFASQEDDLLSDYRLLEEEVEHDVHQASECDKGTHFLPPDFARRQANAPEYNFDTRIIHWRSRTAPWRRPWARTAACSSSSP
jgi:hypothetical protein